MSLLLAAGAKPNAPNSGGQRAVHYAASKGHVEVLRKLAEAGADVDVADKTGSTPLHRAASQGRAEMIRALAEGLEGPTGTARCDIEARNRVRQTPLVVACEAGQDEAAVALARAGADVGAEDAEGNGVATLAPKLAPVLRSIRQGDDGMMF